MTNQFKLVSALLCLAFGSSLLSTNNVSASHGSVSFTSVPEQTQERPAEQAYKNIQVFKGLTESQLLGAMNFMTGALGVGCFHCHTNQFASDDKLAKQTARRMIQMMRTINQTDFGDKLAVNCYTCHQGHVKPAVAPVSRPGSDAMTSKTETMPSVDEILN